MRLTAVGIAACAGLLVGAAEARADLIVFKTGKTMSVKATRVDGGVVTALLRGGGEVTFARETVDRVDPDEVPWPDESDGNREPAAGDRALGAGGDQASADLKLAAEAALAARPFADVIASAATTHGVDLRLVHAVIEAESNYEPRARSRKGAKGLMQLMPETARQYAVKDPYDPRANVDAGVKHLKDLLSRFDVSLALAAYNAGEATIRRFGGVPPYAETKSYVARILRRVGQ
jgi:soluble lytic murein transglycosylase-like protein